MVYRTHTGDVGHPAKVVVSAADALDGVIDEPTRIETGDPVEFHSAVIVVLIRVDHTALVGLGVKRAIKVVGHFHELGATDRAKAEYP